MVGFLVILKIKCLMGYQLKQKALFLWRIVVEFKKHSKHNLFIP